ncbi:unnamed protein product, partial [Meganyctiphanes norvegica]
ENLNFPAAPMSKVCKGRQLRRRTLKLLHIEETTATDADLTSSLGDESIDIARKEVQQQREGRLLFTVWNSSTTSRTITSYSINRGITISALARCTFTGFTTTSPEC